MGSNFIFIYDGQCPFCNYFAQLLELKSSIPDLQILDARDSPPEMPKGYDMDQKGAILIKDGQFFYGASAINCICGEINDPSGPLIEALKVIFQSAERTNLIFPFLIWARRLMLILKGVPRKLTDL